ncbi:DUF742 domain-containing protein [Saccharopolyspora sp. NPDC050389]|uniref:DUF742 domain-containing protein n=1 Tax=Saccharopolyspora sp. NPDC050389 TaxID=3155516 RepID=UPI0033ECE9F0
MSSHKKNTGPSFHPLAFGGWGNYQDWADHQFQPRPAVPEAGDGDASEPDQEMHDQPAEPIDAAPGTREPDQAAATDRPERDPAEQTGATVFAEAEESGLSVATLRPYVRTGGRAEPEYEFRVETLVSATSQRLAGTSINPDLDEIRSMCASPHSVAEISSRLGIPLTVARVLIGDAIKAGLVVIHGGASNRGAGPSLETLQRVYEGLLKLA